MLRFIIMHKEKRVNGLETETFSTLDVDVPELENTLTTAGFSEDAYEFPELIGVEIIGNKEDK